LDPAIEQQAVARVHRIGQTRETVVTRLLVDGTVEVEVLRLLQRKQQLFLEHLHTHGHADAAAAGSDSGEPPALRHVVEGEGPAHHPAAAAAAAGIPDGEMDDADAEEVMAALGGSAPRHEMLDDADARSLLDALM